MFADWPLWLNITVFIAAAGVIGLVGTKLAGLADRLADRTGMGEALMGGLFLGVSTSLPGITASVTAAADGFGALAVSNALGGIAVQTLFLAVADVFHPKVNLEHAAASAPNLVQSTLLILLLALVLLVTSGPSVAIGHVHVGTPMLFIAYAAGITLAWRTFHQPMWQPRRTRETVTDVPDREAESTGTSLLWFSFAASALIVGICGFLVGRAGGAIVETTGFSESVMGGVFMAVATSLPELVTTIAAVRHGAPTLAVGDIVGGNAFDILFICVADIAFLKGSIYHAAGRSELFLLGIALVLNIILLLGLIQRQKRGIANIGFESVLIILIYAIGIALLAIGVDQTLL